MNRTRLLESGSARGTGKRRRAKLISADVWGTSAFYPADVLERDAEYAFPVGTKMFENHLTEAEEWDRPEGNVEKLIGKLISPGVFEADNPEGPGVYADVEFYDSYVDRINEIGDDVGLSVSGTADYVEGEREGRYGKIVTGLYSIRSVDVVVAAGAGGKLVSILESARIFNGRPTQDTEGDQSVTEITKDEFVEGLKGLADTLAATMKESLAPLLGKAEPAEIKVENKNPVEANAKVENEGVVEAEAEVVETPVAEVQQNAAPVEVDLVAVATQFAEAGLPSEVMPNVITAVKEGATVEEAIESQTKIREAFIAQTNNSMVKITESDRNSQEGTPLRERILSAVKK